MNDSRKQTAVGSTTGAGAPASSDRNSLTVGPDGPIVLHDVHFLEQMAHFNREKVPERQPHAKGGGAFGVLKTTEDISRYTKAALFQKGANTEMLARFSTVDDSQRNRIGTNFHQLPVNRPKVPVNTYMFDGQMAYEHSGSAPVYAPNSSGRPWADDSSSVEDGWQADGALVRSAYTLHEEDDDFGQAGTLVREVFNDAQRAALVDQVAGSLLGGVRGPVLERAFDYWKSVDADVGRRIENKVRTGSATKPACCATSRRRQQNWSARSMSSKTLWPARASHRARVANSSPRTPSCSRCRGSTGRGHPSRATTSNACSRGWPCGRWACRLQQANRLTVGRLPPRSSSFASACITSASIASARTGPETLKSAFRCTRVAFGRAVRGAAPSAVTRPLPRLQCVKQA